MKNIIAGSTSTKWTSLRLLATLLGLFLMSFGSAYAQNKPNVVALFGDSITVGYNTRFNERFGFGRVNYGQPAIQLNARLTANNRPSTVVNLGWGGTSSGPATAYTGSAGAGNGVDRIRGDLSKIKTQFSAKNYFALIMYGTNDYARGIPPSVTGFNNGLMIGRANALGYTALVSSITPCDVCPNNVSTINSAINSEVQSQIGSGADAHFVDNHNAVRSGWNSNLSDPDRVHPTDKGYAVIAENWFQSKLKSLIKSDAIVIAPIINLLLDD